MSIIAENLKSQNPELDIAGEQLQEGDNALLEQCTHLHSLCLTEARTLDFSFLKKLPNLRVLYIAFCDWANVDALADLGQLEELYIRSNPLVDITGIQHLKGLKKLDLSHCCVKDLTPLRDLAQLEWLDLQYNELENIEIGRAHV